MNNVIEGKKIVGAKQALKAVKADTAKALYVAMDAEPRITKAVIEAAAQHDVEIFYIETMHRLGTMCSIEVGAAIACVLKKC